MLRPTPGPTNAVTAKAHTRFETQRRAILRRETELTAQLERMPDETLRWTVRVLADCLPPDQQAGMLAGYDEYAPTDALRAFVTAFLPAYTAGALAALDGRPEKDRPAIGDLTDEELQGMAAAEKWHLLAMDPEGLRPYRLGRELARLVMCHTFDLFHDTGLGEAAVEFPTYFTVERALQGLPAPALHALRDEVLARAAALGGHDAEAAEAALEALRASIARAAGFAGLPRPRPGDRMARIAFADLSVPATPVAPWLEEGLAAATPEGLRFSLRVLVDLLNVAQAQAALEPLTLRHATLDAVPPDDLRATIAATAARMGDRQVTDVAERYRSGRFLALPHALPGTWQDLSPEERLRALEADNAAMDAAQTARHLARLLLTPTFDALLDPAAQVAFLRDPRYERTVAALMALASPDGRGRLRDLNAEVTRRMLDLAWDPAADRAAALEAIRHAIASALMHPADPASP